LFCAAAKAQEENNVVFNVARKYISLNVKLQNKFANKVQQQQDKLLKKLCKREERFVRKLKRNDSTGYVTYQQQPITFDSLNSISKNGDKSPIKATNRANTTIDSFKISHDL